MKLLAGLALMLTSLTALAQPYIVTDPLQVGVTQCGVYLDAQPKVVIPVTIVVTGGQGSICKYSISTVTVGTHSIQLTSIAVNDPVWGSQESAKSVPFSFARPGTPGAPTGIVLTP